MQTGAILILIALLFLWVLPLVAAAIVHFLKPPIAHTWIAQLCGVCRPGALSIVTGRQIG